MIEWRRSAGEVGYAEALAWMEARAAALREGRAAECVWLLEHPPLYTAGRSAKRADLLSHRFPVHEIGRGGQYTYHGPGQRVVYLMLDLRLRGGDVRRFVHALEDWVVAALSSFQVRGRVHPGRVGVWVERPEKPPLADGSPAEDKIAAIGLRVSRGIVTHGIAVNHDPDLAHFDGIVPCGIADRGVTSLVDLGLPVTMEDLDLALEANFARTVGRLSRREAGAEG